MEKFVQLVDFPNYLINKNGVIKNKKFNKILIGTSSWKYPAVNLSRNGIKYKRTIHRLLAINFIPNPLNKSEVNHINGITTDFSISNLEWVTPKENMKHSLDKGLRQKYYPQSNPYKLILDTYTGVFYNNVKEASKYSNYEYRYLRGMLNGNHKNKTSLIYA